MRSIKSNSLAVCMVASIAAVLLLTSAGCAMFKDDTPVYLGLKDNKSGLTEVDGKVVRVTRVKPAAQGTYDIMKNAGMIGHEEVMGNYIYFSKVSKLGGSDLTATSSRGTHGSMILYERYKVKIDIHEDD